MRAWLIVYGDGSTFSSEDGPPEEAPRRNAQVVYNADDAVGVKIEQSRFGYWGWRDDYGWLAFQTESGFWDYLMTEGPRVVPLFGRTLRDARWNELQKEAAELATGWEKTGWWKVERRVFEP